MPPFFTNWYRKQASLMGSSKVIRSIKNMSIPGRLVKPVDSVLDFLRFDCGMSNKQKIVFLGALLYVVVTVDACPDVIPFVGFMDDAAVLKAAISNYKSS